MMRWFTGFLAAFICATIGFAPAFAKYWSDPATGLAIGGYDPVAYFTSRSARVGNDAFEVVWKGQFWRFANEGNKAAFIESPETYAPQFDGYGPISVSRGLPAAGNPHVWAIHQDLLYLFHNRALLVLWQSETRQFLKDANSNWPAVRKTIAQ